MGTDVQQFWKLLAHSKLYSLDRVRKLAEQARPHAKELTTASSVAKWLIEKSAITRYHARILLAGRPGPFVFGDYAVTGNTANSEARNLFSARHRPTGHPVLLEFLDEALLDDSMSSGLEQLSATISGCQQLEHPALSRCFELISLEDYKFIVHESPTGPALAKELARANAKGAGESGTQFPPAKALRMISSVANGLGELHKIGLAHGKVSTRSITIRGAARLSLRPVEHFLAAQESGLDDLQSKDVHDLGCVASSLLLGEVHDGESGLFASEEVLTGRLQSVRGMNQSAVQLITRMLAEPPDQFSSVDDVRDAINRILPEAEPPVYQSHKTISRYLAALRHQENESSAIAASKLSEIGDVSPQVAETPSIAAPESTLIRRRKDNRILNVALIATPLVLVGIALASLMTTPAPGPVVSDLNGERNSVGETGVGANGDSPRTSDAGIANNANGARTSATSLPDDGRSLWASPTSGAPVDFEFVPQGSQAILNVRPVEIFAEAEGQRVIKSLGPAFATAVGDWESSTGLRFAAVDELLLAVVPDINNDPQVVTRVTISRDVFEASKFAQSDAGQESKNGRFVVSGKVACLICGAEAEENSDVVRLLLGPENVIAQMAMAEETTPILRREFQELARSSDSESQFSLLLAPSFLLSDGQTILPAPYQKFPDDVDAFLGSGVRAMLVTSHLANDSTFFELRMAATAESRKNLPAQFSSRLAGLSASLGESLSNSGGTFWQSLAEKMAGMAGFVADNTRVASEGTQVVANVSLPKMAAHNLVLGTELALASRLARGAAGNNARAVELSLDEILAKKMSLAIQQQSLEFAIRDFSTLVNDSIEGAGGKFVVRIIGADLQLDGITRNQQIRNFNESDKTVAELLSELCRRANPVTAAALNHPDQKLVWVMGEDPNNPNNRAVLLTTRKAAAAKALELPTVFRSE